VLEAFIDAAIVCEERPFLMTALISIDDICTPARGVDTAKSIT
jgi:hypothetical protein